MLAEVANHSLSVPLFTPHKGRLVEATESNIKAAESNRMIVSLPTLTQDCPLNKHNSDLHPITGMAERCSIFFIFTVISLSVKEHYIVSQLEANNSYKLLNITMFILRLAS